MTVAGATLTADPTPDQVGYLSYEHRLIGTPTAAENVAAMLLGDLRRAGRRRGGRRGSGPDLWRRVEAQLAALDLAPSSWHNLVEQLSGGQQQRDDRGHGRRRRTWPLS